MGVVIETDRHGLGAVRTTDYRGHQGGPSRRRDPPRNIETARAIDQPINVLSVGSEVGKGRQALGFSTQ